MDDNWSSESILSDSGRGGLVIADRDRTRAVLKFQPSESDAFNPDNSRERSVKIYLIEDSTQTKKEKKIDGPEYAERQQAFKARKRAVSLLRILVFALRSLTRRKSSSALPIGKISTTVSCQPERKGHVNEMTDRWRDDTDTLLEETGIDLDQARRKMQ